MNLSHALTQSENLGIPFTYKGLEYRRYKNTISCRCIEDKLKTAEILAGTTKIATEAFYKHKHIEHVHIPDTVTHIGNSAFKESSIETLWFPNSVEKIDNGVLYMCERLRSVRFPKDMEQLSSNWFFKNLSLEAVILPDGLKRISKNAFRSCTALKGLYLPDDVETVSPEMFGVGCSGKTLYFSPALTRYQRFNQALISTSFPKNVRRVFLKDRTIREQAYQRLISSETW